MAFVGNAGAIYRRLRLVIEQGLEATSGKPPPLRARLEEAHEFVAYIEAELPAVLERFVSARTAGAAAASGTPRRSLVATVDSTQEGIA
jgi:hypothetical protein